MNDQRLSSFIANKGFDNFLKNFITRCEADNIDFLHKYANDGSSLTVWLNFGNIPATIQISTDGSLSYTYFQGGLKKVERFINCSNEDFQTMLGKAFSYLRDGDNSTHHEWYKGLESITI